MKYNLVKKMQKLLIFNIVSIRRKLLYQNFNIRLIFVLFSVFFYKIASNSYQINHRMVKENLQRATQGTSICINLNIKQHNSISHHESPIERKNK
jgi:hypothetical protein